MSYYLRSLRYDPMAYDATRVSIADSQSAIRKIVYGHKGTGIIFMSRPPREGFEALVTLAGQAYHIRVMATCKDVNTHKGPGYRRRSPDTIATELEQENRRVWRVLYWHLKAMFEAADSGVIAVEDIIMPYIVTPDGRTIAEHVAPRLAEMREITHERLLTAGGLREA